MRHTARQFGASFRVRFCIAIVLLPLCLADSLPAQITTASEYNLKAVFLYSFGRYTTWPDSNDSDSILIGVVGESPIITPLEQVAKTRKIKGRKIVVKSFDAVDDYKDCDIVFVSGAVAEETLDELHDALEDAPILLVGEADDFSETGGMIRFFINKDTVRFEINVETVKESGIVLDAKLLRLASRPQTAKN